MLIFNLLKYIISLFYLCVSLPFPSTYILKFFSLPKFWPKRLAMEGPEDGRACTDSIIAFHLLVTVSMMDKGGVIRCLILVWDEEFPLILCEKWSKITLESVPFGQRFFFPPILSGNISPIPQPGVRDKNYYGWFSEKPKEQIFQANSWNTDAVWSGQWRDKKAFGLYPEFRLLNPVSSSSIFLPDFLHWGHGAVLQLSPDAVT